MKKIFLILLVGSLINCGDEIVVKIDSVCEKDQLRFDKIFAICMSGQRHTTGTDDADDFVIECRITAKNESFVNCHNDFYYYYWDRLGVQRLSSDRLCKDAENEKEIKACHDYGFRK